MFCFGLFHHIVLWLVIRLLTTIWTIWLNKTDTSWISCWQSWKLLSNICLYSVLSLEYIVFPHITITARQHFKMQLPLIAAQFPCLRTNVSIYYLASRARADRTVNISRISVNSHRLNLIAAAVCVITQCARDAFRDGHLYTMLLLVVLV